jgi:SpoVK/Ycf46/Vps4 family AAA+-type ATPase
MGRLLLDDKRIWTGAEIETLLKKSLRRALREDRRVISLADWNSSIDNLRPKTGAIELQTLLALQYCTDFEYLPEEWREIAMDEPKLKSRIAELKAMV